jgi:hypothetical protein
VSHDYEGLIERLQSIEEDLVDLAYERLRELASDPDGDGADRVKVEERKLLSARRSIAKSIDSLRALTVDSER